MKISKTGFLIIGLCVLFLGSVIVVAFGSKDSKPHLWERRLAAFEALIPPESYSSFTNGNLAPATEYLEKKVSSYKSYANVISDAKKLNFLKAEYAEIDKAELAKVPADLVQFYARYYKMVDSELIQTFSVKEMVSYFKEYYFDWLAKYRKGIPQLELN